MKNTTDMNYDGYNGSIRNTTDGRIKNTTDRIIDALLVQQIH
jgi:hypothetical protein